MKEKMLEAMVASPPNRADLVVQLFIKDGGQWGEVYREDGVWWLDLYKQADGRPWRLKLEEVLDVLALSLAELRKRFDLQD